MLYVRTVDTKAIALQRTGKLGTYAASLGHEATHVGIGASMRPEDVFAPSYREYGAQFMRGVQPREVLMYWGGDERGNDFQGPKNDYPWCVPIRSEEHTSELQSLMRISYAFICLKQKNHYIKYSNYSL